MGSDRRLSFDDALPLLEQMLADGQGDVRSAALAIDRLLAERGLDEMPAGVRQAIAIASHDDPRQRFRSIAQFRNAIREGAAGFLPVVSAPAVARAERAAPTIEPRSRKAEIALWSVIILSLATGTTVLVDKLDRPPILPDAPPRMKRAEIVSAPPAIDPSFFLEDRRPEPPTPRPDPPTPTPPRHETSPRPVKPQPSPDVLRELEAMKAALLQEEEKRIQLEKERIRTMWQHRIDAVERHLQLEHWPEAKRDAQAVLDDHAPEPFAARAGELLQLATEGLDDLLRKSIKVGKPTDTIIRPSRKKP